MLGAFAIAMKICHDYRREGSCWRGERCKFKYSHCLDPGFGFTPALHAALVSPPYAATVPSLPVAPVAPPHGAPVSPLRMATPREACRHWERHGNCRYGDDCKYYHDPSRAKTPRRGECRYGDACEYDHATQNPRTAGQAASSQGTADHPQSAAAPADQANRDSSSSGSRASGGSGDTPYRCIVCMRRPVSVIYDSCRHLCLCDFCNDPTNATLARCPICRVDSGRSSIFLAGVS